MVAVGVEAVGTLLDVPVVRGTDVVVAVVVVVDAGIVVERATVVVVVDAGIVVVVVDVVVLVVVVEALPANASVLEAARAPAISRTMAPEKDRRLGMRGSVPNSGATLPSRVAMAPCVCVSAHGYRAMSGSSGIGGGRSATEINRPG